jgi:phosphoribosylaminoimidazolecarboxamide formyltransferase/IMP cyclohydrolase
MRALLSVYRKDGLIDFARGLSALGFELIATGSTQRALEAAGLQACPVSALTGQAGILDGRVKTLHPAVHAAILARREPDHLAQLQGAGWEPIDLVCGNLYPFTETVRAGAGLEEATEQIDVGGPSMLRGAAKNFRWVWAVSDPADYAAVLVSLREGDLAAQRELRRKLAAKTFGLLASYDGAIAGFLGGEGELLPSRLQLSLERVQALRYGENPHQAAALYRRSGAGGAVLDAELLAGKALSFNNLSDAEAAWQLAAELPEAASAAVKHGIPCGVACAETARAAWERARDADPVSVFGGVVAFNRAVDAEAAASLVQTFLEVIIAPDFSAEALATLASKPNLRLLRAAAAEAETRSYRQLEGGFLVQAAGPPDPPAQLRVVTQRQPDPDSWADLRFAWIAVKHARSNAIVLARRGATVGIGAGQVSRIGAAQQAISQAGGRAAGAVLASDGYFPFDDVVKAAAQAGVRALIQPGGSIRDRDSIAAADQLGLSMVFTGIRHFRHG